MLVKHPMELRRRTVLISMAGLACSAAACRSGARARTAAVPQRLVSLTPNMTEAVFAIGAGGRLVARSRYCDYPPEVKRLPSVGGYVDPSFEAILAARPDLVIGARGPGGRAIVDRLEQRGIQTWFPETETIAQIEAMIEGLADRIGMHDDGVRVADALRVRLSRLDDRLSSVPRPRALLVFGLAPIVVAGPGGFPDEMMRRAGMTNVIGQGTRYPTINVETVLSLDPDLVIDAAMAEGGDTSRIQAAAPGWSAVRAVREGKVATVRDDSVLRPGPRVAEGVARLASIAHPEVTGL